MICPNCGTNQIERKHVDHANPGRDVLKCRHCNLRAPESVWVTLVSREGAPPKGLTPILHDKCLREMLWDGKVFVCHHCLRDRLNRGKDLAQALLDNEPDDMASDCHTVFDVWRESAKKFVKECL